MGASPDLPRTAGKSALWTTDGRPTFSIQSCIRPRHSIYDHGTEYTYHCIRPRHSIYVAPTAALLSPSNHVYDHPGQTQWRVRIWLVVCTYVPVADLAMAHDERQKVRVSDAPHLRVLPQPTVRPLLPFIIQRAPYIRARLGRCALNTGPLRKVRLEYEPASER